MRKILLLALVFVTSFTALGQNYSNKGKDFWISYPEHVNGTSSIMGLYITSDVNTTGTISINGSNVPFSIAANTIVPRFLNLAGTGTFVIGTNSYVHLGGLQDGIKTNAAIHVVSVDPVVVYAHIIFSARSGSSLILPTAVWGKEYIVPSHANASAGNAGNQGYGEFNVMASLPNTVVEITPKITSRNGVRTAGVPYQITLDNPGDVYQLQFPQGADMSGTVVKSIASGASGCQPIAVVSATTWTALNCASVSGGDNFYQQLFPYGTWGKEFFTSPLKKTASATDRNVDVIRVYVKDPATLVQKTENGVTTTLGGLSIGNFYEYSTEYPTYILADKPIQVMEYVKTQGCNAPGSPATQSDPEMIALSSVEQTINDITVYSSIQSNVPGGNSNVTTHYINVTMKSANTDSFKINGATPGTAFIPIPGTAYSYLKQNIPISTPVSRLTADSGFSAVAYGFGNVESYGYNAGTSVKDLNTKLEISNPNSIDPDPSACTNSPFRFKVYFADSTNTLTAIRYDSIRWEVLNNAANFVPNNFPVMVRPISPSLYVEPDSVNLRNGKYVAWYSLPGLYYVTAPGVYPIRITLYRSSNEGCGNSIEYPFDLTVTNPPSASFTAPAPGCYLEPVIATETTPQTPKATYKLWWEFFDPVTNVTTVYSGIGTAFRTISHTFTTPGVKQIRHASITTPGCLSDTIVQSVTLPDLPNATISGNTMPFCINAPVGPDVVFTGSLGTPEYIFTYRINGGAPIVSAQSVGGILTIQHPTNVANTFIYEILSVRNVGSGTCTRNISGQTVTVTITPDATITLRAGDNNNQTVCINNAISNIRYDIAGSGNGATFSGFPPGVNAIFTPNAGGGVVSITGAPSSAVGSPFTYTITPTGPCLNPPVTGTITVNEDGAIILSPSSPGAASQPVCVNTAISTIIFQASGGTTNVTVAGLPPGLTGTYNAGTKEFTIIGSPNPVIVVTTTYNYTVSTVGPCIFATTGGTITVKPDATINLSSAVGTDAQTVCVNNAIVNIVYDLAGEETGAVPDATSVFPPGVTGSYNAVTHKYTITGTPTSGVGSPFNYRINSQGPCGTPFVTGSITVTADGSIILSPSSPGAASQAICVNTAISTIIFQAGGSTTNVTVAGLPPGVTGTYNAGTKEFTILGSPNPVITVTTNYTYTLTTTGPCVNPPEGGVITVRPDATINLSSAVGTDAQTVCVNNAIINIEYTLAGEETGAVPDASSVFPPGVTGSYNAVTHKYTITGTPTSAVGSPFNYRINSQGPCQTPFVSGTITVTDDATLIRTSAAGTDAQELCRNSAITDIIYDFGGSATGATVTGLPAGVTWSVTGNRVTITGSPTVASPPTFTYTVNTLGPCVRPSLTGTILVNQLPTAAFTSTAPRCETRVISFTDASIPNAGVLNGWTWDFGDGAPLEFTQNPTHVYASVAGSPYTVTLTVTTDEGCTSDPIASIPVTIDNRPEAGFIIPEVCLSDTYAQFTDTSSLTNAVIDRWDWNFGDPGSGPLNVSSLQNPTHSYSAVGTYNVRLIVWNFAKGCRDTITQVLQVNGSFPQAIFSVNNPATLCANDSVAVVEASTVFPGTITKVEIWFDNVTAGPPGPPDILDNSPFTGKVYRHLFPNFQTPLTKVFQIRYRAYSGGVCLDDSIRNITVNAAPLVQFNNMPNSCLLVPPFQITQASEIGGVPGTGTYSGPGVSPTGLFNPQTAGIGTHTILYTFTSTAAGCVDTMSNTINVRDTAHATFSYVLPACEQTPVSFTDLSTAPAGVTLFNTVWDFGDGTPIENHLPGSTFTHIFVLPLIRTVTMYTVSTPATGSCLSTDTVAYVSIDPNHVISNPANATQTLCVNNNISQIDFQLSGGATGIVMPPVGLPPGVTASLTGTVVSLTGAPTLAGVYPYSIQTTGNSCQIANTGGVITVNPDHTISFNSGDTMQSVCVNTQIDDIVYNLGGGANGIVMPPGNLPPGVNASVIGNLLTISGTPAAPGTYNYTIQTDGNSCLTASAIGEIVVHAYPVPDFAFDKTSYCIPNATVGFINNTTPAPLSNHTYAWEFGDGVFSTAATPSHFYTSIGPFNVKLKARSTVLLNNGVIGCESEKAKSLDIIHPQPKADFVFSKPSVCIGDNVILTDATDNKDGLPDKWNWNLGDGGTRVTNPVTYTYADTISYTITFYSINTFGCNSDTISKPFSVYPYPKRNAGPDKFVLEGGSVELEASAFAREPVYSWTPVEFLTDSKILRPRVVSPRTDMTYRLTVTGKGGCQASDDVFVKLLKFPAIPNTFTPNGDGINDQWRIDYLNTYPENRVQIFTRAGKLVFESRGYTTPWDGTLKGKPLPFDTYYYIIEPGNGRDPVTGYVTIIK